MHSELLWRWGIPVLQLVVCFRKNPSIEFLRVFLQVEAFAELLLGLICVLATPTVYLYSWLAGTALHHAMCCYLLTNIYSAVRRRGLPWRQSVIPIYALAFVAGAIGFSFARYSLGLVLEPTLKMFLPLDHAISFSIGCMLAMLPVYQFAISSSMPRALNLVMVGFAIYEIAYAGLLGVFITHQHIDFPHAIDVVFLISLFVWSVALRSKNPKEVEECLPITH
jgi:hypothetical protein